MSSAAQLTVQNEILAELKGPVSYHANMGRSDIFMFLWDKKNHFFVFFNLRKYM